MERREHPRIATVIEVKYRHGADFALDFARDISQGGLYLSSESPLPVGERVELWVSLPNRAEPLVVNGEVRRSVRDREGTGGMGIAFDTPGTELQAEIDAYLSTLSSNREVLVDRRGIRHPIRIPVATEQGTFHTSNLGANGLFLADADLPLGSPLDMRFAIPDAPAMPEVRVAGTVVHRSDGTPAAGPRGIGVRFDRFEEDGQQNLWNYLQTVAVGR